MKTSQPRIMEWANSTFQPRFEHGDQAQVAHLCGTDDGSKQGAGFGCLTKASFEWMVQYDEIILVLEGEVTPITETETLWASRLDTILPRRRPHAALATDIKADWVVIDAGCAGLAAARQLPPRPLVEVGARATIGWEVWKIRAEA